MVPESGPSTFMIMRRVVVLPAPLGPRRPKEPPRGTARDRSFTAWCPEKALFTPERRIASSLTPALSARASWGRRVYHRAFAGIPREREGRGRALRRSAVLPSRRAGRSCSPSCSCASSCPCSPWASSSCGATRKSCARRSRRASPATSCASSRPSTTGCATGAQEATRWSASFVVYEGLDAFAKQSRRVARRPRPEVVPRVAARALPRLRIALHRGRRRGACSRARARSSSRTGRARSCRAKSPSTACSVSPLRKSQLPRAAHAAAPAADPAAGNVGAARPRARLLRGAARPARDGVDARRRRHRPRSRALAARRGRAHPRPRGQGGGRRGRPHVPRPARRRRRLRRREHRRPGHAPRARAQRVRPAEPRGAASPDVSSPPCPARAPSRRSRSRGAASSSPAPPPPS